MYFDLSLCNPLAFESNENEDELEIHQSIHQSSLTWYQSSSILPPAKPIFFFSFLCFSSWTVINVQRFLPCSKLIKIVSKTLSQKNVRLGSFKIRLCLRGCCQRMTMCLIVGAGMMSTLFQWQTRKVFVKMLEPVIVKARIRLGQLICKVKLK